MPSCWARKLERSKSQTLVLQQAFGADQRLHAVLLSVRYPRSVFFRNVMRLSQNGMKYLFLS
jgi:hypothetical protein